MNWTGGSRNTFLQRRGAQKRNRQRRHYFQQQRLQRLACRREEESSVDLKEALVNRLVLDTDKRRQIMQCKSAEAALDACDNELPPLAMVSGGMASPAALPSTSSSDAHLSSKQSRLVVTSSRTSNAAIASAGKTVVTFTSRSVMPDAVHESGTLASSLTTRPSATSMEHAEAAMAAIEHLHARVDQLETTVRELVQYLFSPDYLASK